MASDLFLHGHNTPGLLLLYGHMKSARDGFQVLKHIDAWEKIGSLV